MRVGRKVNSALEESPPKLLFVQVDYVEPSQNQISLKMIPRIDFDRIKARMSLVRGPDPQGPLESRWPDPRKGPMAACPKGGFFVVQEERGSSC